MEGTLRIIGMNIHRVAAEVVSLLDGEIVKRGRVQMLRNNLEEFARRELTHDDHLLIETAGNATAVAEVLSPYVDRIVIQSQAGAHDRAREGEARAGVSFLRHNHRQPTDGAT
ncbi:hypothetical protein [Mesorhizobium neociceri]|uniref:Uncharacterized protein n=1 Tax=Mesorhizobium neociceri TaxID=1307853 RepID=A0A838B8T4_9HYPH|nr:hypothetical protein [Mesorhizobium neociceri]MBA1142497.1 hypothetical protein [Mesorhizobium neociceri]